MILFYRFLPGTTSLLRSLGPQFKLITVGLPGYGTLNYKCDLERVKSSLLSLSFNGLSKQTESCARIFRNPKEVVFSKSGLEKKVGFDLDNEVKGLTSNVFSGSLERFVLLKKESIYKDIYTSFQIRKYEIHIHVASQGPEEVMKYYI